MAPEDTGAVRQLKAMVTDRKRKVTAMASSAAWEAVMAR